MLMNLVILSGSITLLYFTIKLLSFAWFMLRCYVFPKFGLSKDLKKYGDWAVVTGATDGIGKEYARQLAAQGLKVVLISRSEDKLKAVQDEIEGEFKVTTKIISYDFSRTDGYNVIEDGLKDLNVGVLVNNVGMAAGSELVLFEEKQWNITMDRININIVSDVMMSHIVLKGMMARGRGAVIHVASSCLYMDLPLLGVYPPTKAFIKKFYQLLSVEHGDVIDHQLVIPAVVATKMSGCPPSLTAPTAEDYVKEAVRTIGVADIVWGCWIHELQGALLSHLPLTRGMNWSMMNSLLDTIEKAKKQE